MYVWAFPFLFVDRFSLRRCARARMWKGGGGIDNIKWRSKTRTPNYTTEIALPTLLQHKQLRNWYLPWFQWNFLYLRFESHCLRLSWITFLLLMRFALSQCNESISFKTCFLRSIKTCGKIRVLYSTLLPMKFEWRRYLSARECVHSQRQRRRSTLESPLL